MKARQNLKRRYLRSLDASLEESGLEGLAKKEARSARLLARMSPKVRKEVLRGASVA